MLINDFASIFKDMLYSQVSSFHFFQLSQVFALDKIQTTPNRSKPDGIKLCFQCQVIGDLEIGLAPVQALLFWHHIDFSTGISHSFIFIHPSKGLYIFLPMDSTHIYFIKISINCFFSFA